MSTHTLELTYTFRAPCESVFAALADHERFGALWPGHTERIQTGEDGANGRGSIRRIRAGLSTFEETTVEHVPAERIVYRITRGTPLRKHEGVMQLHPVDGGTRLDYRIHFECPIPFLGPLIEAQLRRSFNRNIAGWAAPLEAAAAA